MSIRLKLFFLMIFVVVCTVVLLVLFRYGENHRLYTELAERTKVEKQVFDDVVALESTLQKTLTNDYSFWDEMIIFISAKDDIWGDENIIPALETYKVDKIWVLDRDMKLRYGVEKGGRKITSMPIVSTFDLNKSLNESPFNSFYASTLEGLIEIKTAPIQPVSDVERLSEAQGYLVTARVWNEERVTNLEDLTRSDVSIVSPEGVGTPVDSEKSLIVFNKLLLDVNGKEIAKFHVQRYSSIIADQIKSFNLQFVLLSLTIIVLLLVVIFLLNKWITEPMGKITNSIKKRDASYLAKLRKRNDEFGDLSRIITRFYSQRENLLEEVYRRKKISQALMEKSKELAVKLKLIGRQNITLERAEARMTGLVESLDKQKDKLSYEKSRDEALLSSIGDGVITVDSALKIVMFNKQAEEMFEITEDEVLGKDITKVIKLLGDEGKEIPYEQRPLVKAIKDGKRTIVSYFTFVGPNGIEHPVSITVSPVKMKNKVIAAMTVFRDYSKEKEVDRMKTEFISLASHQLRTPLSAMRWYSEMLLSGDAGKMSVDQKDYVNNINLSTMRMIELVNALLNVSRIETGRMIIEPRLIDVNQVVSDCIEEVKSVAQVKGIIIEFRKEKNLDKISLDPKLVRQIVLNLLTNAIKYSFENKKVVVKLEKHHESIVTVVSNEGYGIAKAERSRIFEKFYRGQNVLKQAIEGTGLGLYLVKSIVEAMNGKIWFDSTLNKRTTFYVQLPSVGIKPKKGDVALENPSIRG